MNRYEILMWSHLFRMTNDELRAYFIELLSLKHKGLEYNEADYRYCSQFHFDKIEEEILKNILEIEDVEKKLKEIPGFFHPGSPQWEKQHALATRLNFLKRYIRGRAFSAY